MAPEANFYTIRQIVVENVGKTVANGRLILTLHEAHVLHEQLEHALQDADYPPKG